MIWYWLACFIVVPNLQQQREYLTNWAQICAGKESAA